MQRWLGLIAVAALLLQSGCSHCIGWVVAARDNQYLGHRLLKKLDLAEVERLVAKDPALTYTRFSAAGTPPGKPGVQLTLAEWVKGHDGGLTIGAKRGWGFGVVFFAVGDAVYVNFDSEQTRSCKERMNLQPLYALIDQLPISDSHRRQIRQHVRVETARVSGFPSLF